MEISSFCFVNKFSIEMRPNAVIQLNCDFHMFTRAVFFFVAEKAAGEVELMSRFKMLKKDCEAPNI